jgi:hypothetical protein
MSDGIVSLYVVKTPNGDYFAGFDTEKGKANFETDPRKAKMFSNKYNIKLRPQEMLVELVIDLMKSDVKVSEPFRPARRINKSKSG